MKKLSLILASLFLASYARATDLKEIYQQAAQNNGTYLAAQATYKAASYGVPIARAALLPSVVGTGSMATNRQNVSPSSYTSNAYELTLTQPLLAVGSWYAYSQSEATYKQAAITYAQAEQNLIMTVASAYFGVLEAQDQLKYAQANQNALSEQLRQTEAQYKVGVKALTDVQYTRANYESAVASTVAAKNGVNTAIANLIAVTGRSEKDLALLKQNFPLIKPNPQDMESWVKYGLKNNLALQSSQFQAEIDRLGIKVNAATGYLPTVNAEGSYSSSKNSTTVNSTDNTNARVTTKTAALNLNYNVFSGGSTYATVKQSRYTYKAAKANVVQTQRDTVSNVRQAYLNVLSDISQVQAYQQAVISGETSLKAIRSGYLVGIRTIVDVLTAQSNLFSSQQQYAQSIYNYINDSLTLKEQAGNLSPQDLIAINTWLEAANTTSPTTTASPPDTKKSTPT